MTKETTAKGTIVKIERFGIHDGPGIRTVVFFKGCPLRCKWCSTPESQTGYREMVYYATKCTRCRKCVDVCPPKAISVSADDKMFVDKRFCDNCGKCVEVCHNAARKMLGEEMTVEQIMTVIEKDTVFYWNSGGGVTLSGGEPGMQPKFALAILEACKEKGVHTAIETCGHVEWSILSELLKYLDLVYLDIKHILPIEHERLTGKRNDLILENCKRIISNYPRISVILRIPVIPGHNDSEENITKTAEFVCQLSDTTRVEILPYHKFGVHMYPALSRDYALPEVKTPSAEHMRDLQDMFKSCGITAKIGG